MKLLNEKNNDQKIGNKSQNIDFKKKVQSSKDISEFNSHSCSESKEKRNQEITSQKLQISSFSRIPKISQIQYKTNGIISDRSLGRLTPNQKEYKSNLQIKSSKESEDRTQIKNISSLNNPQAKIATQSSQKMLYKAPLGTSQCKIQDTKIKEKSYSNLDSLSKIDQIKIHQSISQDKSKHPIQTNCFYSTIDLNDSNSPKLDKKSKNRQHSKYYDKITKLGPSKHDYNVSLVPKIIEPQLPLSSKSICTFPKTAKSPNQIELFNPLPNDSQVPPSNLERLSLEYIKKQKSRQVSSPQQLTSKQCFSPLQNDNYTQESQQNEKIRSPLCEKKMEDYYRIQWEKMKQFRGHKKSLFDQLGSDSPGPGGYLLPSTLNKRSHSFGLMLYQRSTSDNPGPGAHRIKDSFSDQSCRSVNFGIKKRDSESINHRLAKLSPGRKQSLKYRNGYSIGSPYSVNSIKFYSPTSKKGDKQREYQSRNKDIIKMKRISQSVDYIYRKFDISKWRKLISLSYKRLREYLRQQRIKNNMLIRSYYFNVMKNEALKRTIQLRNGKRRFIQRNYSYDNLYISKVKTMSNNKQTSNKVDSNISELYDKNKNDLDSNKDQFNKKEENISLNLGLNQIQNSNLQKERLVAQESSKIRQGTKDLLVNSAENPEKSHQKIQNSLNLMQNQLFNQNENLTSKRTLDENKNEDLILNEPQKQLNQESENSRDHENYFQQQNVKTETTSFQSKYPNLNETHQQFDLQGQNMILSNFNISPEQQQNKNDKSEVTDVKEYDIGNFQKLNKNINKKETTQGNVSEFLIRKDPENNQLKTYITNYLSRNMYSSTVSIPTAEFGNTNQNITKSKTEKQESVEVGIIKYKNNKNFSDQNKVVQENDSLLILQQNDDIKIQNKTNLENQDHSNSHNLQIQYADSKNKIKQNKIYQKNQVGQNSPNLDNDINEENSDSISDDMQAIISIKSLEENKALEPNIINPNSQTPLINHSHQNEIFVNQNENEISQKLPSLIESQQQTKSSKIINLKNDYLNKNNLALPTEVLTQQVDFIPQKNCLTCYLQHQITLSRSHSEESYQNKQNFSPIIKKQKIQNLEVFNSEDSKKRSESVELKKYEPKKINKNEYIEKGKNEKLRSQSISNNIKYKQEIRSQYITKVTQVILSNQNNIQKPSNYEQLKKLGSQDKQKVEEEYMRSNSGFKQDTNFKVYSPVLKESKCFKKTYEKIENEKFEVSQCEEILKDHQDIKEKQIPFVKKFCTQQDQIMVHSKEHAISFQQNLETQYFSQDKEGSSQQANNSQLLTDKYMISTFDPTQSNIKKSRSQERLLQNQQKEKEESSQTKKNIFETNQRESVDNQNSSITVWNGLRSSISSEPLIPSQEQTPSQFTSKSYRQNIEYRSKESENSPQVSQFQDRDGKEAIKQETLVIGWNSKLILDTGSTIPEMINNVTKQSQMRDDKRIKIGHKIDTKKMKISALQQPDVIIEEDEKEFDVYSTLDARFTQKNIPQSQQSSQCEVEQQLFSEEQNQKQENCEEIKIGQEVENIQAIKEDIQNPNQIYQRPNSCSEILKEAHILNNSNHTEKISQLSQKLSQIEISSPKIENIKDSDYQFRSYDKEDLEEAYKRLEQQMAFQAKFEINLDDSESYLNDSSPKINESFSQHKQDFLEQQEEDNRKSIEGIKIDKQDSNNLLTLPQQKPNFSSYQSKIQEKQQKYQQNSLFTIDETQSCGETPLAQTKTKVKQLTQNQQTQNLIDKPNFINRDLDHKKVNQLLTSLLQSNGKKEQLEQNKFMRGGSFSNKHKQNSIKGNGQKSLHNSKQRLSRSKEKIDEDLKYREDKMDKSQKFESPNQIIKIEMQNSELSQQSQVLKSVIPNQNEDYKYENILGSPKNDQHNLVVQNFERKSQQVYDQEQSKAVEMAPKIQEMPQINIEKLKNDFPTKEVVRKTKSPNKSRPPSNNSKNMAQKQLDQKQNQREVQSKSFLSSQNPLQSKQYTSSLVKKEIIKKQMKKEQQIMQKTKSSQFNSSKTTLEKGLSKNQDTKQQEKYQTSPYLNTEVEKSERKYSQDIYDQVHTVQEVREINLLNSDYDLSDSQSQSELLQQEIIVNSEKISNKPKNRTMKESDKLITKKQQDLIQKQKRKTPNATSQYKKGSRPQIQKEPQRIKSSQVLEQDSQSKVSENQSSFQKQTEYNDKLNPKFSFLKANYEKQTQHQKQNSMGYNTLSIYEQTKLLIANQSNLSNRGSIQNIEMRFTSPRVEKTKIIQENKISKTNSCRKYALSPKPKIKRILTFQKEQNKEVQQTQKIKNQNHQRKGSMRSQGSDKKDYKKEYLGQIENLSQSQSQKQNQCSAQLPTQLKHRKSESQLFNTEPNETQTPQLISISIHSPAKPPKHISRIQSTQKQRNTIQSPNIDISLSNPKTLLQYSQPNNEICTQFGTQLITHPQNKFQKQDQSFKIDDKSQNIQISVRISNNISNKFQQAESQDSKTLSRNSSTHSQRSNSQNIHNYEYNEPKINRVYQRKKFDINQNPEISRHVDQNSQKEKTQILSMNDESKKASDDKKNQDLVQTLTLTTQYVGSKISYKTTITEFVSSKPKQP